MQFLSPRYWSFLFLFFKICSISGTTRTKLTTSHNGKGYVLMFSKSIGVKDYNEAELYAILEAFCKLVCVHQTKLIVESDLSNAISWVSASSGVLGSSNSSLMRSRHYPC